MMATATRRIRVTIHHDQDASNPLDDAPFGTMVLSGRDGVQINGDWKRDVNGIGSRRMIHDHMRGERIVARVDVPRSYVDQNASDGFIYATPADVIREFGADTPANRADALRLLAGRAEEYRAWADGYSYGYTVEELTTCPTCGEESATEVDACWGFTTRDPEHDLLDWLDMPSDEARAALAVALSDGWTGDYPTPGRGTVSVA